MCVCVCVCSTRNIVINVLDYEILLKIFEIQSLYKFQLSYE